jgi:hypothetical protein
MKSSRFTFNIEYTLIISTTKKYEVEKKTH